MREGWRRGSVAHHHRLRCHMQLDLTALALPRGMAAVIEMRDLCGIAGDKGEHEYDEEQPPRPAAAAGAPLGALTVGCSSFKHQEPASLGRPSFCHRAPCWAGTARGWPAEKVRTRIRHKACVSYRHAPSRHVLDEPAGAVDEVTDLGGLGLEVGFVGAAVADVGEPAHLGPDLGVEDAGRLECVAQVAAARALLRRERPYPIIRIGTRQRDPEPCHHAAPT